MEDYIFSFLSHFIGRHSWVVPKLNITLDMCLNVVLAIVSVGYIVTLFLFMFPAMSSWVATSLAIFILFTALPFEYLNSKTQNSESLLANHHWIGYPTLMQIFMLGTSLIGAIQYLIRNYTLVLNFTKSPAGRALVMSFQKLGYAMSGVRFAVVGGLSAFFVHFLLAYSNWDKYTKYHTKNNTLSGYANLLWFLILGMLLPFEFSILAVGLYILLINTDFPKGLGVSVDNKKAWFNQAVFFVPMGAFLYGLVDFFNSYAIVTELGVIGWAAWTACLGFGALSFLNITFIWGYNVVRFMYGGVGREVDANSWFVKLYYCDPSIRRLSVYLKEGLLCGLDLLNNQLILGTVNQVLYNVFGVSIGLFALNLCTVSFAINKVLIMMFQSGVETQEFVTSKDYKKTPLAKVCQRMVNRLEVEWPEALGMRTLKAT